MNVSAISQNQQSAGSPSAAGTAGPANGFALLLAALGGQTGGAAGADPETAGLLLATLQGQASPQADQSAALPGLAKIELPDDASSPDLLPSDDSAEREEARAGLLALFAQNAARQKPANHPAADSGAAPAQPPSGAAEAGQDPAPGNPNDLAQRLFPGFGPAGKASDAAGGLEGPSAPIDTPAEGDILAGRQGQAGLVQAPPAQPDGQPAPARSAPARSPLPAADPAITAAPSDGAGDPFAELSAAEELAALRTLADVRPTEGQLPTAASGQSFQENLAQAQVLGRQLSAQAGTSRQAPGNKSAAGQNAAAQQGAAANAAEAIPGRSVAPEPAATSERTMAPARFVPTDMTMLTAAGLGGSDGLGSGLSFETGGAALQSASASAKGAETAQAAQARGVAPDVSAQLAIQIQRAINSQTHRFSIRLEPAELGRVDVKLDFRRDGTLRAAILVERPETLEMLQKDTQGLERALKARATEPGKLRLDFGLQGQGQQDGGQQARPNSNGGTAPLVADLDESLALSEGESLRQAVIDGLVDIRV